MKRGAWKKHDDPVWDGRDFSYMPAHSLLSHVRQEREVALLPYGSTLLRFHLSHSLLRSCNFASKPDAYTSSHPTHSDWLA